MNPDISTTLYRLGIEIFKAQAVKFRDVDNGEEPYLYSSGNRGPGYIMIKGLVSHPVLRDALVAQLAWRVAEAAPHIQFVAGNVTGGVPYAVLLGQQLSMLLGRPVPVVYVRDTRKRGGLREHVTGLGPHLGDEVLVVEELVNFATTTTNSALLLRSLGYAVRSAACVVTYDTPVAQEALAAAGVTLHSLYTVRGLLQIAETAGLWPREAIQSYRNFLDAPERWMAERGFTRDERGGTR